MSKRKSLTSRLADAVRTAGASAATGNLTELNALNTGWPMTESVPGRGVIVWNKASDRITWAEQYDRQHKPQRAPGGGRECRHCHATWQCPQIAWAKAVLAERGR